MYEKLNGKQRTAMCGNFVNEKIGSKVTAMGWVQQRRDLGNLVFLLLRDRSGVIQVTFNKDSYKNDFSKVDQIKYEYCICVEGILSLRSESAINPKMPTGKIEIIADDLKILSSCDTLPFTITDDTTAGDNLRLKYRYLDLRRPAMQKNIILRSKVCKIVRNYLDENGFLEVETPILGKSTPEGARDYLVPSRTFPGTFFALPQSPQLYKQMLMVSGFDRYYQIARCFRDEDLRADRQPEFTQVDVEMSFIDKEESVMQVMEGMICELFEKTIGFKFPTPFIRMTYAEAMDRFGSDKPDTRFGMELVNISKPTKNCTLEAFCLAAKEGSVRAINVKGQNSKLTRKELDNIGAWAKGIGAAGLSYITYGEEGIKGSITKFFEESDLNEIVKLTNLKKGDTILIIADKDDNLVKSVLGKLRLYVADKFNIVDKTKNAALWVVDFPLFEFSKEENRFVACHHPFTAPKDEDIAMLDNPEKLGLVRAKAYDCVINGYEAGGGSIRIYDQNLQNKMFTLLGLTPERIEKMFGWFANAFRYGAPPHGGLAFGLERLVMLLLGTDDIKNVLAFPKVQTAADLLTDAPSAVAQYQLDDLKIQVKKD